MHWTGGQHKIRIFTPALQGKTTENAKSITNPPDFLNFFCQAWRRHAQRVFFAPHDHLLMITDCSV